MGKVSGDDKMRIQTLREQGFGARAIISRYPEKGWKLSTISKICKRVDERNSAVNRNQVVGDQSQLVRLITLRKFKGLSALKKIDRVQARAPDK